MNRDESEVDRLFAAVRAGDRDAVAQLFTLFYPELQKLAASKMRQEKPGHTWQPTVLVNELYLQLLKIGPVNASGRSAKEGAEGFMALSAHLMKRMLISHARLGWKQAQKIELDDSDFPADESEREEIEALLAKLGSLDPVLRSVVELKVFEGLTAQEAAERLQCSPRTIHRHWEFARHWLQQAFRPQ